MGDLADQWETPERLRHRPDYARVWAMKVLSGKWALITDGYWDDCVIRVPFMLADERPAASQETTRRFYR